MATIQYTGARYVPKIFGQHDRTQAYEPLSIVVDKGGSFTSRKAVPVGVSINDSEYWVETGIYDASIETYRKEVRDLSLDLDNEIMDRTDGDDALDAKIDSVESTLDTKITAETTAREIADTALQNSINDIRSRLNHVPTVLFIGDSYGTDFDGTNMVTEFQSITGWTVYNYCEGGSGYVRQGVGGNNFIGEARQALTDGHGDVDYVIIIGGRNDELTPDPAAAVETAARDLFVFLGTNFTKAEIHAFACLWHNAPCSRTLMRVFTSIQNGATGQKAIVHEGCMTWGLGFSGWFIDNDIHPNSIGAHVYGTNVAKMLNSVYCYKDMSAHDYVSGLNGCTIESSLCSLNAGVYTIQYDIVVPSALAQYTSIAKAGEIFERTTSTYYHGFTTRGTVCLVAYNADGTFTYAGGDIQAGDRITGIITFSIGS